MKVRDEKLETYDEYLERMETTNSWGVELELNSAAHVTGYSICVFKVKKSTVVAIL